jgi:hypothetical protein
MVTIPPTAPPQKPLRCPTPEALWTAYNTLYPGESSQEQGVPTLQGWMERYQTDPMFALATQNWYGKVTKALFLSLGIKQPRTKAQMLLALRPAPYIHQAI